MDLVRIAKFIVHIPKGYSIWWNFIAPVLRRKEWHSLVDIEGFKMILNLGLELDFQYALGLYDKRELEFLVSAYEEDTHFLDIGANQGFYTLYMASKIPNARIMAFEPDPRNYDKLNKNIRINRFNNIKVSPCALSDNGDPKTLFLSTHRNWGGSSMVVSQLQWQKKEVAIKVPCMTLLDVLKVNDVKKVSCAKMDIEGYEYVLLKKFFEEAPRTYYPQTIIVEEHGHVIDLVGGSSVELLINQGYRLTGHTDYNYFFRIDK